MRFEGRVYKDGKHWLVEVEAFDAMTQGRTKKEAYDMIKDLLETMADAPGFEVHVFPQRGDRVEIGSTDVARLIALLLRRQREKHGLSLADMTSRLGQTSRNAYARYEQGRAVPTIEKLEELLDAVAPEQRFVWRLTA